MEYTSICVFKDCDTLGLDQVPLNAIVKNAFTGEIFKLTSKPSITNSSKLCDLPNTSKSTLLCMNNNLVGSALFYGGTQGSNSTNICSIITNELTLAKTENNVGTSRIALSGDSINSKCVFYGGYIINTSIASNLVTILSSAGSLMLSETSVGTARSFLSCVSIDLMNIVGYGGLNEPNYQNFVVNNILTTINSNGSLLTTENNVGTARRALDGCKANNNVLFYGGQSGAYGTSPSYYNIISLVSTSLYLTQAETNIGTNRGYLSGVSINSNCLFYGGTNGGGIASSIATLLTPSGVLAQSETPITTSVLWGLAGSETEPYALYHGGYNMSTGITNNITTISSTLTIVRSDANIGTARYGHAGAPV